MASPTYSQCRVYIIKVHRNNSLSEKLAESFVCVCVCNLKYRNKMRKIYSRVSLFLPSFHAANNGTDLEIDPCQVSQHCVLSDRNAICSYVDALCFY